MLYLCIFRYFSYNQLKAMDLKIQDIGVMETPHTIKKKDFKVLEVYSYGIDDTFVETLARKKKKAEEGMLKLFQDKDYE